LEEEVRQLEEETKTWSGSDGEFGAAGQVGQIKEAGEVQGAKVAKLEARLVRMEEAREQENGRMAKEKGEEVRRMEERLGGEVEVLRRSVERWRREEVDGRSEVMVAKGWLPCRQLQTTTDTTDDYRHYDVPRKVPTADFRVASHGFFVDSAAAKRRTVRVSPNNE
jgi:hypothetical protein